MSDLFYFKQFNVDQSNCAMKINTDGVLLGALANSERPGTILDIGTGTGVIALMLAQRFPDTFIDGVEVDASAAFTAQGNFANAPFAARLKLFDSSFEIFFKDNPEKKYDLIVSNPPFYLNSLQSPEAGKKLAKHTDIAFFEDMFRMIPNHLNANGLFWLILPIATAKLVKELADKVNLYLQRVINIRSYPDSIPHRELLAFGHHQTKPTISKFVIYEVPKQYSTAYQVVLKDFFTIF